MDSIVFRPADPHDAMAIQTVIRQSWESLYKDLYPQEFIHDLVNKAYSVNSLKYTVQHEHADVLLPSRSFVAVAPDQAVIGYAHVNFECAGIYMLKRIYVLPTYQGKGVGKRLLRTIIDHIVEMTVLLTWVDRLNRGGCRFYEQNGFVLLDESVDDEINVEDSHLIMYSLHIRRKGSPLS